MRAQVHAYLSDLLPHVGRVQDSLEEFGRSVVLYGELENVQDAALITDEPRAWYVTGGRRQSAVPSLQSVFTLCPRLLSEGDFLSRLAWSQWEARYFCRSDSDEVLGNTLAALRAGK